MNFIETDIQREISWARFCEEADDNIKNDLVARGILKGAGNFLAALGLLTYTEALGKFMNRRMAKPDGPRGSFDTFFRLMGEYHAQLITNEPNLYDKLRSNFVHEYSPRNIQVSIFSEEFGVSAEDERWQFSIEPYFMNFMSTAEKHKEEMYEN